MVTITSALEAKKVTSRIRRAKLAGKAPRPEDVAALARWRKVRRIGRPPTIALEEAPVEGGAQMDLPDTSGEGPAPHSTIEGGADKVPELPAPDVRPAAGPEGGGAETDPSGGRGPAPAGASEPPPSSAPPPSGQQGAAVAQIYKGILQTLNAAAQQRGCWITFPEEAIEVLTAYAAEVLAPYEAMVNKPAMVLGAPILLGVQIVVKDVSAKKAREKAEREAAGFAPPPPPPPPVANGAAKHAPEPPTPDPEPAAPAPGPRWTEGIGGRS